MTPSAQTAGGRRVRRWTRETIIEKILEPGEELPDGWEVDGTTGYDFLAVVNGLWVAPDAGPRLTDFYRRFTSLQRGFPEVAHAARLAILRESLASEIHMLAQQLERIAQADRRSRDFTLAGLTRAIVATIAAFPVYRTYVRPDGARTPADDACIDRAIGQARRRRPDVDASVFAFLREVLRLRRLPEDPAARAAIVKFAMRFAQITGPVIAKGVEDTALYRYNRMVCLNEVGCDPDIFGVSADEFHAHNTRQRQRFPRTMTATATHDTKRGEDLRARLAVISEIPDAWRRAVSAWSRMGRTRKTTIDGELAPTRNDGYLFYQTVVGALPLDTLADGDAVPAEFIDRVAAYMNKATKEAKQRTSWLHPNAEYDAAVDRFVREMLAHPPFVAQVRALALQIAPFGAVNSLAQLCLKLASPGVPDTYQGSELWNFSLVDPDNRTPVDYALRRALLDGLDAVEPRALLDGYVDGRIKLRLTQVGLRHRREHPALYLDGTYEPIAGGRHLVALRRRLAGQQLVCVVPRLGHTLTRGRGWPISEAWGEQRVALGEDVALVDLVTGRKHTGAELRLAEVFAELPFALLYGAGATA